MTVTAGKIVALLLFAATAVTCLPYAFIVLGLLLHAPDPPFGDVLFGFAIVLLIAGAWLAAWLAWRHKRWVSAWLALAVLLGVFAYWWSILELP